MSGLLTPTSDAPIDMLQPVNWLHPLNRGLAAWYLVVPGIGGSARWMDLTNPGPHGHHGTLTNMDPVTDWVARDRRGGFGALDFDGTDDYVALGEHAALQPTDAITVAAWVKIAADNAAGQDQSVVDSRNNGSLNEHGYSLQVRKNSSSRNVRFFIYDGAFQGGGTFSATFGQWHHIVGTWSKKTGNVNVYVDVKLRDTFGGNTSPIQYSNSDVTIGRSTRTGDDEHVNGQVDDVRIFDRELTALEVRQLYYLRQQRYPGVLRRVNRSSAVQIPTSPYFFRNFILARSRAGAS